MTDDLKATLEIKNVNRDRTSTLVQAIRTARRQARRIVVDGRNGGVAAETAREAIRSALRQYGTHVDEIVVVTAPEVGIGWSHGSTS